MRFFFNELEKQNLLLLTLHTQLTSQIVQCHVLEAGFVEDGNVANSSVTGGKLTLIRTESLYFCTHISSTNKQHKYLTYCLGTKTYLCPASGHRPKHPEALQPWHKRVSTEINGNFLTELMRGDHSQHQSHLY